MNSCGSRWPGGDVQERREAGRAALDAWVEIAAAGTRRRASVEDVSVGGLGLRLDGARIAHGTEVIAEFPLPGIGLPLEVNARVMWADTDRLGLRFEDIDGGLEELLESYVDGRLRA
jgi:c-di-GMP-binding flagellar brake protein YcgR